MEYLNKYIETADQPIHFYVAIGSKQPKMFFTYTDLIKNVSPDDYNMVYCYSGSGKILSEFYIIRGLKGETIIANEPSRENHELPRTGT